MVLFCTCWTLCWLWDTIRKWLYKWTHVKLSISQQFRLCGLARLSIRSYVAVPVFCMTCLAWVKILNTPEFVTRVYNVPLENISLGIPSYRTVAIMLSTLFVVSVMYTFIYISTFILYKKKDALDKYHESVEVDIKEPENTSLLHFIGFFNAFVFSLGLGCAGMTKPQKESFRIL
jgi:hypothetical protein